MKASMRTNGFSITRQWLLSELPLRKVEKQIIRRLKSTGFSAILKFALRKDLLPTGDVGVVDVDVELGKFYVHAMPDGKFYVEAVYAGTADVDVKVKDDSGLPFAALKTRSLMVDLEVVAEIDVAAEKITGFDVTDPEIF
jgi:hypothetical protein